MSVLSLKESNLGNLKFTSILKLGRTKSLLITFLIILILINFHSKTSESTVELNIPSVGPITSFNSNTVIKLGDNIYIDSTGSTWGGTKVPGTGRLTFEWGISTYQYLYTYNIDSPSKRHFIASSQLPVTEGIFYFKVTFTIDEETCFNIDGTEYCNTNTNTKTAFSSISVVDIKYPPVFSTLQIDGNVISTTTPSISYNAASSISILATDQDSNIDYMVLYYATKDKVSSTYSAYTSVTMTESGTAGNLWGSWTPSLSYTEYNDQLKFYVKAFDTTGEITQSSTYIISYIDNDQPTFLNFGIPIDIFDGINLNKFTAYFDDGNGAGMSTIASDYTFKVEKCDYLWSTCQISNDAQWSTHQAASPASGFDAGDPYYYVTNLVLYELTYRIKVTGRDMSGNSKTSPWVQFDCEYDAILPWEITAVSADLGYVGSSIQNKFTIVVGDNFWVSSAYIQYKLYFNTNSTWSDWSSLYQMTLSSTQFGTNHVEAVFTRGDLPSRPVGDKIIVRVHFSDLINTVISSESIAYTYVDTEAPILNKVIGYENPTIMLNQSSIVKISVNDNYLNLPNDFTVKLHITRNDLEPGPGNTNILTMSYNGSSDENGFIYQVTVSPFIFDAQYSYIFTVYADDTSAY
ncbi:MAG: hypothetical protein OEY49_19090, partial [Candidatus Heimdallarchaeota archaeon]|nr:hypothetical protein [Candidatus Heimdallarchaeota archaeon]